MDNGVYELEVARREFDGEEINRYTALKNLFLYETKGVSFEKISAPTGLKKFDARLTDIRDFSGIEKFRELENINLLYARSFRSISGISQLKKLKKLWLGNCPKLTDIDELALCPSLKELYLEGIKKCDLTVIENMTGLEALRLSDCGSVSSLKFIGKLDNLEFFSFVNTNVLDGDLRPCLRLKYAGTLDKRHYNIKSRDLPQERTRYRGF
ncbi:MAG: hypothetical protein LBP26_05125 [Clostridiales bacterium]|jgi:Leucine-rich repeat (LRR) protein|nr:hypothetical protein [Clostridiales bacterium]